jgi:murein L,D-transpeptidase YafK
MNRAVSPRLRCGVLAALGISLTLAGCASGGARISLPRPVARAEAPSEASDGRVGRTRGWGASAAEMTTKAYLQPAQQVAATSPPPAAVAAAPEPPKPEIPNDGLAIVVEKRTRTLSVFNDGVPVRQFPVVIGRNSDGPKRYEGDMRTPEGAYRVMDKRRHARWQYFIDINYPNEHDVEAYAKAVSDGRVPVIGGEYQGIGGSLGIHGSDHHAEQDAGKDWTRGCVAMHNHDVAVVYDLVEPGTPVLILP